jgi:hypothetical protein
MAQTIGSFGSGPAGLKPRWTIFTSDTDDRDGEVRRILDLQCVSVGGAVPDADFDCMSDAADANDANPDQDGDLVPDGVEVASGSSPTVADADADGANDYVEMFNGTNPTVADTDGDGSADKPDNGADEDSPTSPSTVLDTVADDNCPADSNGSQLNTDSANDTRILPTAGALDTTNPHQDTLGNACDTDDDNDGMTDVAEPLVVMLTSVGDSTTAFCEGPGTAGTAAPAITIDPLDADSDNDLGLDGRECQGTTRPDFSDTRTSGGGGPTPDHTCPTPPAFDAEGCARLQTGKTIGLNQQDPDSDQLFSMGFTDSSGNGQAESFYRTQAINVLLANDTCDGTANSQDMDPDCDANNTGEVDSDSDNDGLSDGVEVRYYGTHPAVVDSDSDGCADGREAADVDGNRTVGASDLGGVANTTVPIFGNYRAADGQATVGAAGRSNYDYDRNGAVGASDLGGVAARTGSCGTPSNQSGPVIGGQMKLYNEP